MKATKGTVLCTVGMALAIAAVGVGDTINGIENAWVAFGYVLVALMLIGLALVLCALGVNAENERVEREGRKVKRAPYHTNEWRDAQ